MLVPWYTRYATVKQNDESNEKERTEEKKALKGKSYKF